MGRSFKLPAALAGAVLLQTLSTPAEGATLRGFAVDETLQGPAVLAEALRSALVKGEDVPAFARIVVERAELEPRPGELALEALDERIRGYAQSGVPVVLALRGPLPDAASTPGWRAFWRALAQRFPGRISAYELGELAGEPPAVAEHAFAFKAAAVEIRSADADALLVHGPVRGKDAAWLETLFAEDVAAYLDAVAVSGREPGLPGVLEAIRDVVRRGDPSASLVVSGLVPPADAALARGDLLFWLLAHEAGQVALTSFDAPAAVVASVLRPAAALKDVFKARLVTLDDKSAGLRLAMSGRDVTTEVPHALYFDLQTNGTLLVYRGGPGQKGELTVELQDSTGLKPTFRDVLSGQAQSPTGRTWDGAARVTRLKVPIAETPSLIAFAYAGDTAMAARADVTAGTLPPVSEIVFKHQQAQARLSARVKDYMADARMESHFRPSNSDSGFDVVTDNRFYSSEEGVEWEETSFTLNGTKWGPKRPPFPLLQAEKVLSLPLDLRLSKDYRYRLEGVERVGSVDCYAVRFDPVEGSRSLYRGTVWIEVESFLKVKLQTTQTNLQPPILASEEIQFFEPVATPDAGALRLLSRFVARQTMLIAGRSLLVERQVVFSNFSVNSPDFLERRAASRASESIMFKDTERGLRHFLKKNGTRVVEERPTTNAKALAMGTLIDPSYEFPLPILGLNYLDFDFLGKDNQLALLFAGVFALANVQRPKALFHKLDASVDIFVIAVPVNDQSFGVLGEKLTERVRDYPFSTGLNLGWQLGPFNKLTGNYLMKFDSYSRAVETSPTFVPPPSTVTNGFGLGYEYRRGGYSLLLTGYHYRRAEWRPWGDLDEYSPAQQNYEKYSASLSKDFHFQAVHKVHLNLAYFGGKDLDRFNAYQSGLFEENRIHGVPASVARFGELTMFRGSYSFNVFDIYRLDLFFDQALGREPRQAEWQSVTGIGLGFNLRGPKSTLLRGELGKSFLPERYRGAGSFVAQIMILKPL